MFCDVIVFDSRSDDGLSVCKRICIPIFTIDTTNEAIVTIDAYRYTKLMLRIVIVGVD